MRRWGNVIAFYTKRDYMSNHYPSKFVVKGITFGCCEQFMMFCKAMLFGDRDTAQEILKLDNPQAQKLEGRRVKWYEDKVWLAHREKYILIGMLAKYEQNPKELGWLLDTGDAILVEASVSDTIYGVGLGEDDPRIQNPYEWRGANLCGELTMKARSILRDRVLIA